MSVTAKEVQELRKISGAGMMECKSALSEANGDVDIAFKLLREKGIAKAEKKSSREAKEGLIGIKVENQFASIIEINSETDFVSRNSEFHDLCRKILDLSIKNVDDAKKTSDEAAEFISQAVGKIGENIVLKRVSSLRGNIYSYVHNSVDPGLGKIGVLLQIETDGNNLDEIGKNICMHIAATSPKAISEHDLDKSLIDSEREIIEKQLEDSGKPKNIIEKMMEGKLKKFYEESTLLGQKFVMDPSITVSKYLSQASNEMNCQISVSKFLRFEVGE
jgi:elongation factor Ts